MKRKYALDEAQASIRTARFAPELHSTECYALFRDAIVRLHNADLRVRDVKVSTLGFEIPDSRRTTGISSEFTSLARQL